MTKSPAHGPIPFHPWLFALAPVLSVYVSNHGEIPLFEAVRPAVVVLAGATVLWGALRLALRGDVARSAILTSLAAFLLYSYAGLRDEQSFLHQFGESLMPNPQAIAAMNAAWPVTISTLWCVILVASALPFLLTCQRYPDLSRWTPSLNVAGCAIVAIPVYGVACVLVQVCSGHLSARYALGGSQSGDPKAALSGAASTASAPDIYCIVLDAYGRQDSLQHYYRFDNSPFTSELKRRGFYVCPDSHANYDQTELCLSAALGMQYLADDRQPGIARGRTRETAGLANSPVSSFLRTQGYRIVAITCEDWLARELNPDLNVLSRRPGASLSALEWLLVGLTPFGTLPALHGDQYEAHRAEINDGWDALEAVAAHQPERKFVYTHILAPHPPFVFGPNGEDVSPTRVPFTLGDGSHYVGGTPQRSYRDGYVGQLQYVNTRTLAAIDTILAASKTPPIILVMGDHGSRQYLNWEGIAQSKLPECFSNLTAVLMPDGSAARVIGRDVSPVNHFRLLLGHLLGANLPRLPDRSFYSTSDAPFIFTDVTGRTAMPSAGTP